MSPSLTLDHGTDDKSDSVNLHTPLRTLLLAPPSIASHEDRLRHVLSAHDRSSTDLQMLDRLAAGLVQLPPATYEYILILTDADGTRRESSHLMSREVLAKIVQAMGAGGKLQAQDESLGQSKNSVEQTEAILAGLIVEGDHLVKPQQNDSDAVPLKLRRKDKSVAVSDAGPPRVPVALPLNGKRKSVDISSSMPKGVGFVDFSDDLGAPMITGEDDDDDELIDEDTLLTEEDLRRPVNIPPECAPKVGKRRRACKDCTCGLAQKLEAEDAAQRASADAKLATLKLDVDDLAEVDFTVQGKVGSCGNCSLGDAFRCDGCPYIGMPAFKPGEEVRLLNNDVQL